MSPLHLNATRMQHLCGALTAGEGTRPNRASQLQAQASHSVEV